MISWRARRQLIIAFIVVIPITYVGYRVVASFLSAPPTCFDRKQNQGEHGIDCGGPCAPCEAANPKSVQVFSTRGVLVRPNVYDLVAHIENPNEFLSADNVRYEFTLVDQFGVITQRSGNTFLLPRSERFIIEPAVESGRAPQSIEFRIQGAEWQLPELPRSALVVEATRTETLEENGKRKSVVEATIGNQSPHNLRGIEVDILVSDRDGNTIGVNKIEIEFLASGSRRTIRAIWPNELAGDIGRVEVLPVVNLLNPEAIAAPE